MSLQQDTAPPNYSKPFFVNRQSLALAILGAERVHVESNWATAGVAPNLRIFLASRVLEGGRHALIVDISAEDAHGLELIRGSAELDEDEWQDLRRMCEIRAHELQRKASAAQSVFTELAGAR